MSFAPSFDHPSLLSGDDRRASKEARRIAQVRTKIARCGATDDDDLGDVRVTVEKLVKGEEYVTGSRMIAYRNVGRTIGKSESWVRKLLGRQDGVGLQFADFRNIVRAYSALCERIEAAAAAEKLRAEQLESEANHAFDRGASGLVAQSPPPARR